MSVKKLPARTASFLRFSFFRMDTNRTLLFQPLCRLMQAHTAPLITLPEKKKEKHKRRNHWIPSRPKTHDSAQKQQDNRNKNKIIHNPCKKSPANVTIQHKMFLLKNEIKKYMFSYVYVLAC